MRHFLQIIRTRASAFEPSTSARAATIARSRSPHYNLPTKLSSTLISTRSHPTATNLHKRPTPSTLHATPNSAHHISTAPPERPSLRFVVRTKKSTTNKEGDGIFHTLCQIASALDIMPPTGCSLTLNDNSYCVLNFALPEEVPNIKLPALLAAYNDTNNPHLSQIDVALHTYFDDQTKRIAHPHWTIRDRAQYIVRPGMDRHILILRPETNFAEVFPMLHSLCANDTDSFIVYSKLLKPETACNSTKTSILLVETPACKQDLIGEIQRLPGVQSVIDGESIVGLSCAMDKPYWLAHMVWMDAYGILENVDSPAQSNG